MTEACCDWRASVLFYPFGGKEKCPVEEKGKNFMSEKKTALYDIHVALGGKMVPFGGYLLPVQYSGVIAEHMAVRERAGLFDVSHMGEVILQGPDALANLQRILTNDYGNLQTGQARYGLMCNPEGGVIDDLIVYRLEETRYMLVPNASNREKDVMWLQSQIQGDAELVDQTDGLSLLALQGPSSQAILAKLVQPEDFPSKYYWCKEQVPIAGAKCLLSQTGYTGEQGYEIYMPNENAVQVWNALMEAGKELGLIPCGLGARDTLRLEASMPLYGHEMNEEITPMEAGLGFAVKMNKEDFIGKAALAAAEEPLRLRVGLKVEGKGIVREEAPLYAEGNEVGRSTSGTHCPYLGGAYAMALVDRTYTQVGQKLEAEVRGRRIPVEVVAMPFYKRK